VNTLMGAPFPPALITTISPEGQRGQSAQLRQAN
jgi:hypothetical protein